MSIFLPLKLKGKPVLRGHEHFWSIIMARHHVGDTFSIRDIDLASNANTETVRDFVRRLVKAGLIEEVAGAPAMIDVRYRSLVIQSSAPRVRRDGSVIESLSGTRCMWNLMRAPMSRGGFTYRDLVHWSKTDETAITATTAKTYIQMLSAAGYLIQTDAGKPGTPATWRLDPKMNTGPQAPMILRTKLVFDPNRQEVMGSADAEEVLS